MVDILCFDILFNVRDRNLFAWCHSDSELINTVIVFARARRRNQQRGYDSEQQGKG
jgi:hypothetical protein